MANQNQPCARISNRIFMVEPDPDRDCDDGYDHHENSEWDNSRFKPLVDEVWTAMPDEMRSRLLRHWESKPKLLQPNERRSGREVVSLIREERYGGPPLTADQHLGSVLLVVADKRDSDETIKTAIAMEFGRALSLYEREESDLKYKVEPNERVPY